MRGAAPTKRYRNINGSCILILGRTNAAKPPTAATSRPPAGLSTARLSALMGGPGGSPGAPERLARKTPPARPA
eukprot:CAMPEP_0202772970 /NCGR_PEP_ID=MMETSP1388-20130828/43733_1 /ASSEMBLY_ACC=CAM_ASM_000864 /TAXON_ID=37098 /ORGANISM="Isochrysis sp, Strain CCMP1244" /LENGTH=73 /DNA_ID=CAMNT_0049441979 /DNA_START=36 /DNA_END=254 /DNA_ORIENTATION=-